MTILSVRAITRLLVGLAMALGVGMAVVTSPPRPAAAATGWSYETVAEIPAPATGCTGTGKITGFAFDPSARPVLGWEQVNGCSDESGHWWGRRPAGPAGGPWVNNRIIQSYGCGPTSIPHRGGATLSVSPTGVPFLVFEDNIGGCGVAPYYGTVRADLEGSPNGPGTYLEGLGASYFAGSYDPQFASGFGPDGTVPHWVTVESSYDTTPQGSVRFDGQFVNGSQASVAAYAASPNGTNHVVYVIGPAAYHSNGSGPGTVIDGTLNRFTNTISVAANAAGVHAAVAEDVGQPGCTHNGGSDWDLGCLLYDFSTDGGSWTPTVVDEFATFPSIAIDPGGQPCIAYLRQGPLWLACRSSAGSWIKSLVSDPSQAPAAPRLTFDPAGNPVVAFSDDAGHKILIAKGRPLASHETSTQVTAPLDGATVSGTVSVSATATPATGAALSNLAILVDGVQLRAGSASPLSAGWDTTAVSNGVHTIRSTATDSAGGVGNSPVTTVQVKNGPAIGITTPITGASVAGLVPVNVTAVPALGTTLTSLSVQVDNDPARTATSSPLSFGWDTTGVPNRSHTITATAVESDGLASTTVVTVNVANLPAVQLTSPPDRAVVAGLVALAAAASPAAGTTLSRLSIWAGPTELVHGSTAPQNAVWDTTLVANGTYQIAATAVDSDNLSSTVSVTVVVANPPSIRILTPSPGPVEQVTHITTASTAALGTTMRSITVSIDGQPPLTAAADGTFYWYTTGLANGSTHTIVATAIASDDGSAVSEPVAVVIANPPMVTVAATPVENNTVAGIVTVTATATPALGTTLSTLSILIDGNPVTPAPGSSPLTYSWVTTSLVFDSPHSYGALARDSDGQYVYANDYVVRVRNLPAVQVTDPVDGAIVSGVLTVTATATAPPATTLASLSIKVNGRELSHGPGSPQSFWLDTSGDPNGTVYSIIATAVDADFGRADSAAVRVTVSDTSPPTTKPTITPTPNASGWNRDSVTVTLTATDPDGTRDVASIDYSASGAQSIAKTTSAFATVSIPITTEGVTVLSYRASDRKGNAELAKTLEVRIDRTAPTVTYTGNVGTYSPEQSVNITCSVIDPLVNGTASGLAASTCHDVRGPAYSFSAGSNSFAATATDNAGNVGSGSTTFTVSVTYGNLCNLTKLFIERSPNFQALSYQAQQRDDRLYTRICEQMASVQSPPPGQRLRAIRLYKTFVQAMVNRGFLTRDQAGTLDRLADSL